MYDCMIKITIQMWYIYVVQMQKEKEYDFDIVQHVTFDFDFLNQVSSCQSFFRPREDVIFNGIKVCFFFTSCF